MADTRVVLGIFKDEASADAAVDSLKAWDEVDADIKLNAIGVLVLDDKGKVKAQKLGKRSVGKGAGIGLILALLTPVGLVAGILGGGILGALHHKGLGLKAEDRARIGAELEGGKAAVGVLAGASQAVAIKDKLTELGGSAEILEVTDEATAEADAVAPTVEAAEAAAPAEGEAPAAPQA